MRLLWIDLETGGFDPQKHPVLEVAVGMADFSNPFELQTMDRFVLRYTDEHTYGPGCSARQRPTDAAVQRFLAKGTPTDAPCLACDFQLDAREMHQKSGLLAECATAKTTIGEAEDYLLTLVHGEPERSDERPVLAGANVWFDRLFLLTHAPRFAARIAYRCYDVSAIKLFCRSLGMPQIPKAEAHRAEADILESVRHARECANWLEFSMPHQRVHEHAMTAPQPVIVRSTVRDDQHPSVAVFPDGHTYDYATREVTKPVAKPSLWCLCGHSRPAHAPDKYCTICAHSGRPCPGFSPQDEATEQPLVDVRPPVEPS